MQALARQVRGRFARFEQDRYGRSWTPAEVMLGFVGDVGDLSKLVQGKSGVRAASDLDAKVAHELADCFWSVLTLADCYGVDLAQAFNSTMADINRWLDEQDKPSET
ncbi:nucleotide pyrophosphohydrolase [Leekyejoonella antrihumi]|uniref:Nucleotide pyrophosphohydrolase n=1 Tax=Leekyejoonella antrihumi TaxID=1660198 RepID=A0A563DR97_9MICO|nr:nucleotide pyrophosphohydrolase [Leekyejoonella antrihumi]TWP32745.1 nucleotide pyrophosphohydrolase [Leekyejoonella antrihumi]